MINLNRSTDKQQLDSFLLLQRTESAQSSFGIQSFKSERYIPTNEVYGMAETNGRIAFDPYLILPENSKILGELWHELDKIYDVGIRNKACELLNSFQEIILIAKRLGIDTSFLPTLKAIFDENDKSLLVEWIFGDFRIGFSLESNYLESGWYLVSNINLGSINASGELKNLQLNGLVIWLFLFALNHG